VHPVDGAVVTVRHCEVIEHPPLSSAPVGQRHCFFGELVNALNTDVFTLSADPERNGEWLQPEFTIHGFQHAEITGLTSLRAGDVEAVVIGANISQGTSSLRLGSELLQKIQNATVWGQRANTQDILTDCNQVSAIAFLHC
jgi:alpha-L-rhamnosidase